MHEVYREVYETLRHWRRTKHRASKNGKATPARDEAIKNFANAVAKNWYGHLLVWEPKAHPR